MRNCSDASTALDVMIGMSAYSGSCYICSAGHFQCDTVFQAHVHAFRNQILFEQIHCVKTCFRHVRICWTTIHIPVIACWPSEVTHLYANDRLVCDSEGRSWVHTKLGGYPKGSSTHDWLWQAVSGCEEKASATSWFIVKSGHRTIRSSLRGSVDFTAKRRSLGRDQW